MLYLILVHPPRCRVMNDPGVIKWHIFEKMQQYYSFVFGNLKEDTSLATVDGEKLSGTAI